MSDEITIHGHRFALRLMPLGTWLYHGTDSAEFEAIRAPAWFYVNEGRARTWALSGRVLRFRTAANLWLFDVPTREEFFRLNFLLTGGSAYQGVPGRHTLADLLKAANLPGWYGGSNDEVLLTNTDAVELVREGVLMP